MTIAGEMEVLKDLEAVSARAAELIADRIRGWFDDGFTADQNEAIDLANHESQRTK